ncbi:S24 family peptidase [Aliivibrio salmonicida]|uniref:S24 family peptidase n=1 Tax=Aliivibrio salmonicida TaxID=40269 RepID=UPI00406C97B9
MTSNRNPLNCVQLRRNSQQVNKQATSHFIFQGLENGSLRSTTMLNTSMHPTIPINSAVIVNRESKYNEDGIYAFEHNKSVMVRRIQIVKKMTSLFLVITTNTNHLPYCLKY